MKKPYWLIKYLFLALCIISLWIIETPMNWVFYGEFLTMFFFVFIIEEIMRGDK